VKDVPSPLCGGLNACEKYQCNVSSQTIYDRPCPGGENWCYTGSKAGNRIVEDYIIDFEEDWNFVMDSVGAPGISGFIKDDRVFLGDGKSTIGLAGRTDVVQTSRGPVRIDYENSYGYHQLIGAPQDYCASCFGLQGIFVKKDGRLVAIERDFVLPKDMSFSVIKDNGLFNPPPPSENLWVANGGAWNNNNPLQASPRYNCEKGICPRLRLLLSNALNNQEDPPKSGDLMAFLAYLMTQMHGMIQSNTGGCEVSHANTYWSQQTKWCGGRPRNADINWFASRYSQPITSTSRQPIDVGSIQNSLRSATSYSVIQSIAKNLINNDQLHYFIKQTARFSNTPDTDKLKFVSVVDSLVLSNPDLFAYALYAISENTIVIGTPPNDNATGQF